MPTWRATHFIIQWAIWSSRVHPLAATLVGVEPATLGDTFGNFQATAQGETLSDILAKVKAKTLGDKLFNVEAQALVDMLV